MFLPCRPSSPSCVGGEGAWRGGAVEGGGELSQSIDSTIHPNRLVHGDESMHEQATRITHTFWLFFFAVVIVVGVVVVVVSPAGPPGFLIIIHLCVCVCVCVMLCLVLVTSEGKSGRESGRVNRLHFRVIHHFPGGPGLLEFRPVETCEEVGKSRERERERETISRRFDGRSRRRFTNRYAL